MSPPPPPPPTTTTTFATATAEFVSGALFAVGLYGAGVWKAEVIRAQFSFKSNVMITVMMGASMGSAVIIHLTHRVGLFSKTISPPPHLGLFPFDGNVLGGMLIGIGMAMTGSCPGTSFVQAGAGESNGLFVIVGGLLGAGAFVKVQEGLGRGREGENVVVGPTEESPLLKEVGTVSRSPSPELDSASTKSSDIAAWLGVPPFVLLLVWIPICLTVMRLAILKDRSLPPALRNPGLVPPVYGGLIVGCAQAATILLTKHAIGASGGYEDVARWINGKISSKSTSSEQALFTGSVIFSAGILCASAFLQLFVGGTSPALIKSVMLPSPMFAGKAVVGGFAMVLGARLAKGCTSGHGISGLSKFSLPSLISTVSMFAAGIATAAIV